MGRGRDPEDALILFIVVAVILGSVWAAVRLDVMRKVNDFLDLPWLGIGIILLIVVIVSLASWQALKVLKRRRVKRQSAEEIKQRRKKDFEEIKSIELPCSSSEDMKKCLEHIKEKVKIAGLHRVKEYEPRLTRLFQKYHDKIRNAEASEEKERLKQEEKDKENQKEEEKQNALREKEIGELFRFMRKHRSPDVLPKDKEYPINIINAVKVRMRQHTQKKEERQTRRNEAIDYYSKHSLDTKPHLKTKQDEDIYAKTREDLKTGKLKIKKEIKYAGAKLPKDFYRTNEMTNQEKLRASAQGFESVKGNELDGKIAKGFYIRKNPREGKKHFCMKHLFAEVHDNMKVEYQKEGKRADVALFLDDFKLAIEIETGKNELENFTEKILWLNRHFDQWIIVCTKDKLKEYNKLVDHQKSFAMRPKQAKEFILSLDPPVGHR